MDPSSLSPSKPAAPTAAQPILASALLSNLLHRHYNQLYHEPLPLGAADPAAAAASRGGSGVRIADQREYKIRTGNAEVDDYVLLGGVERGVVLGLSSDIAGGEEVVGRVISLNLLATTLLSSRTATGTILDCTGSPHVQLLARILRHRILEIQSIERLRMTNVRASAGIGHQNRGQKMAADSFVIDTDASVEEVLKGCLERVNISRIFDMWGICEVLGEIIPSFEEPGKPSGAENVDIQDANFTKSSPPSANKEAPVKSPKEMVIEDSEAEDDDSLTSADSPPLIGNAKKPQTHNPNTDQELEKTAGGLEDGRKKMRTEIVIIDNMTAVISEVFASCEITEAHTRLTTLSRSLHSLTRQNNILLILLNGLSAQRKPATNTNPNERNGNSYANNQYQNYSPAGKQSPSIFQSTTSRPAFGRIFASMLDLHLFISRVPKSREDSDILYRPSAEDEDRAARQQRVAAVEWTNILEVLSDEVPDYESWTLAAGHEQKGMIERKGTKMKREQRWCAIDIVDGVEIRKAFESGPKMGGRPELRQDADATVKARIFGPGGRRG